MTTPERSVEEIVEEFWIECHGRSVREDGWIGMDGFAVEKAQNWLTQTLQAERQRCDEMVEAERERILLAATKIISNPVEFMELTVFTQPNNPK